MSKRIRVRVPGEPTQLIGPTGDMVTVNVDEAGRWADLLEDDARLIVNSGLPSCLPWRELNPGLAEALGPLPSSTGINVRALQQAIEDVRPVRASDKGGITNQTMSMLGRAR